MATWHQRRNVSGLQALWQPHPTQWKCVSDKHDQCAGSISFTDEAEARAYCERTGNILIPPAAAATSKYGPARIAWELERTALGEAYYGNALRVAKDLPGVIADDRALLDRYATGRNTGADHVALQDLALRIRAAAETP